MFSSGAALVRLRAADKFVQRSRRQARAAALQSDDEQWVGVHRQLDGGNLLVRLAVGDGHTV